MKKRTVKAKAPDSEPPKVVERPDGFYWRSVENAAEYGPFPTRAEAVADMESSDEGGYEPGESLVEAEAELGIAEWIDPETGEPAEESVPRIEEH